MDPIDLDAMYLARPSMGWDILHPEPWHIVLKTPLPKTFLDMPINVGLGSKATTSQTSLPVPLATPTNPKLVIRSKVLGNFAGCG